MPPLRPEHVLLRRHLRALKATVEAAEGHVGALMHPLNAPDEIVARFRALLGSLAALQGALDAFAVEFDLPVAEAAAGGDPENLIHNIITVDFEEVTSS